MATWSFIYCHIPPTLVLRRDVRRLLYHWLLDFFAFSAAFLFKQIMIFSVSLYSYQYSLSDSPWAPFLWGAAAAAELAYSPTPLSPLNTPSGAKTEGAFVVGKSPQQLSANFLMLYSTNSISLFLKRSAALRESGLSSTMSTGLRFFISAPL